MDHQGFTHNSALYHQLDLCHFCMFYAELALMTSTHYRLLHAGFSAYHSFSFLTYSSCFLTCVSPLPLRLIKTKDSILFIFVAWVLILMQAKQLGFTSSLATFKLAVGESCLSSWGFQFLTCKWIRKKKWFLQSWAEIHSSQLGCKDYKKSKHKKGSYIWSDLVTYKWPVAFRWWECDTRSISFHWRKRLRTLVSWEKIIKEASILNVTQIKQGDFFDIFKKQLNRSRFTA